MESQRLTENDGKADKTERRRRTGRNGEKLTVKGQLQKTNEGVLPCRRTPEMKHGEFGSREMLRKQRRKEIWEERSPGMAWKLSLPIRPKLLPRI
jgi:hypothetical protein